MFVLDEPYISELLKTTIEKNKWQVVFSNIEKNPSEKIKKNFTKKIYTNSENSLNYIMSALLGTDLPLKIQLFKDKAKFRELLFDIYPDFFFKKVSYENLPSINPSSLKYPLIIKPSVGFLSFGVHTVQNKEGFLPAVEKIKFQMEKCKGVFPKSVLSADNFIIEEYIKGEEYALDVYFDDNSMPVILNIFYHPFINENDVSDRMYITSARMIWDMAPLFQKLLIEIGKKAELKNFPIHIELRKNDEKIIPVEINPLRFAGWCTTDLAYYAYGINVYEYFMENKKPDWELIKSENKSAYAFVMGEVPMDIKKESIISFDIGSFKKELNAEVLEERIFDFTKKPVFCVLFIRSESYEKIKHILSLDIKKYIKTGSKVAF